MFECYNVNVLCFLLKIGKFYFKLEKSVMMCFLEIKKKFILELIICFYVDRKFIYIYLFKYIFEFDWILDFLILL